MTTKVGVIGDKVGSGKSFVLLALISSDTEPINKPFCSSHAIDNVQITRYLDYSGILDAKTNVLVVPHNLCVQWSECLRMHCSPDVTYLTVSRYVHYTSLADSNIQDYDLIVVTSTFYNFVADLLNLRRIRVRRVIYDEADSMKIQRCRMIPNKFAWFVTASYTNLISSSVSFYSVRVGSTGYIKDLFSEMNYSMSVKAKSCLVVRNKDAFVDASFRLPDITVNIVECKTPYVIDILHGNIDAALLERLNANDVQGALQCVDPNNIQSERNIVDTLVQSYSTQHDMLLARISRLHERRNRRNARTHASPTRSHSSDDNATSTNNTAEEDESAYNAIDRKEDGASFEEKISRLSAEKDKLACRIHSIRERITGCNACGICYDDLDNKTVVTCCSHAYCFKCINMWLSSRQKFCPMCKAHLDLSKLLVVNEQSAPDEENHKNEVRRAVNSTAEHSVPTLTSPSMSKLSNFERIVQKLESERRKVLVFSNYDTTLEKIHEVLDRMRIVHSTLKGAVGRIRSVVDKYKNGDLNVLLVNASAYGSGLNLQNTTDVLIFHKFNDEIEHQVIGRAQRFGRTESLNVWYLLHANETASVQ
jgi:GTPase SAR1 family protein